MKLELLKTTQGQSGPAVVEETWGAVDGGLGGRVKAWRSSKRESKRESERGREREGEKESSCASSRFFSSLRYRKVCLIVTRCTLRGGPPLCKRAIMRFDCALSDGPLPAGRPTESCVSRERERDGGKEERMIEKERKRGKERDWIKKEREGALLGFLKRKNSAKILNREREGNGKEREKERSGVRRYNINRMTSRILQKSRERCYNHHIILSK